MNRKPITTRYEGTIGGPLTASEFAVTVDGQELPLAPSLKLRNHSPTGFAWGYSGSGPSQLALAILFDYYGDAAFAQRVYQRFKERVVSRWPIDGSWSLDGGTIDTVVEGIE